VTAACRKAAGVTAETARMAAKSAAAGCEPACVTAEATTAAAETTAAAAETTTTAAVGCQRWYGHRCRAERGSRRERKHCLPHRSLLLSSPAAALIGQTPPRRDGCRIAASVGPNNAVLITGQ
jgi:hypothetical protein